MQQQHRSEIQVSLNDSAVQGAIRRMTDGFKKMGEAGKRALSSATPSQRTMQNLATGVIDAYGRVSPVAQRMGGMGLHYAGRATIASARLAGRATIGTARFGFNRAVDATQFGINSGANIGNTLATGDTASALRASGAIGAGAMNMMGLGKLAGALPFVGNLAGAVVQRRMSRLGQVAGLERLQTELRFGGASAEGFAGVREKFAEFGISGREGLGSLRALQRGIGQRSSLFDLSNMTLPSSRLAGAQLRGIDPSALGQFMRGGAMGGGAQGTVEQSMTRAIQIINAAQNMGMTGAGTQRLLSAIASNTQRLASEGLQIDETKFSRFVFGVSEEARKRGFKQLEGIGALSTVQRFQGGVGGIAGGFRSQFGGIARGALIAGAARNATGPLGVIRRLEAFQKSPELALRTLRGQGMSGEMLRLALSGLGLSQDQITTLLGAKRGDFDAGAVFSGDGAKTIGEGMVFSRAMQLKEQAAITAVQQDQPSASVILDLNETMEQFALSLTKSNGLLVSTIREDLKPTMERLVEALSDPTPYLKDLLGL